MISRVYVRNWKSHHETEMTFAGGVNVLVGEMGSGKSSVVEAVTFGLYGTTPAINSRRVTLDEVIRRTPTPQDAAVVEVDFDLDGTTYTVRREVERGKGTATSELRRGGPEGELLVAPQASEVTEEVEDLLGVEYDLFARAIYSEQNELDYFLNLRAGKRKEKIDELLKLDRFETARSTLVSLVNRLQGRRKDRREDVEELAEDLDEAAVDDLEDRIAELEEEMGGKRDDLEDVEEDLAAVEERFDEMRDRKERFEELKQKRTALGTRIEALEEEIAELEDAAGDAADLDREGQETEREELADAREKFEERVEAIEEHGSAVERLEERRDDLADRVEDLEERVEELEELDAVEEELDERCDGLEDAKRRRQELETRIAEIDETVEELSSASDECPTCGQELTEEHRVTVLRGRKEEREELEEDRAEVTERIAELEEDVERLEERRDDLVALKGAADDLADEREALEEVEEDLEETRADLEELREDHDPGREDELDARAERLDAAADLLDRREALDERRDELDAVAEELDDLEFDEDALEAVREERSDLKTEREVLENDIENREELLEERRERLADLEEKRDRLDRKREAVREYRAKEDRMNDLLTAVEETQTDLRERFVESVNTVMADVWDRVYPYDDYDTVRLNPSEDYAIELQDEEGRWVSVDGEVSGGERHSAALTLRIALSITLAPSWRTLILDEPTHNLDGTTIEDLAETLRTRVADIVDQLFLITHEERLETAVTGELYKLSKKGTRTGLSEVERAEAEI